MADQGFDEIKKNFRNTLRSLIEILKYLFGIAFIAGWWLHVKYIRLKLMPRLPYLFLIVAAIEFVMLMTEGLEELHRQWDFQHPDAQANGGFHEWIHTIETTLFSLPAQVLIAFSIVSMLLALLMYWHHHRVTRRVQEHMVLLNSMTHTIIAATRPIIFAHEPEAYGEFMKTALRALVESTAALKGFDPNDLSNSLFRRATIVEIQSKNDWFAIKEQYPIGIYRVPDGLLKKTSAAGMALEASRRAADPESDKGLIYIPWTRYRHGTRHWVEGRKPQMDFIRDAFLDLGADGDPKPQSIICSEIPVPQESNSRYVLCLDSTRWACFEEVDFQALQLVASMIGLVITEFL